MDIHRYPWIINGYPWVIHRYPWTLEPTALDLVPTPLDQALVQPQSLPLPDSMFWCACCLTSPCTPTRKGGGLWPPPRRGARGLRPSPPFVESCMGGCAGGWTGSKHTKTLSPVKASFGPGPVPDPAVLVLDPVVLVLHPEDIILIVFRETVQIIVLSRGLKSAAMQGGGAFY